MAEHTYSKNIEFLTAYHNAKLAEFSYISESEIHVDTKANVILAASLTLLAILLANDSPKTCYTFAAIAASVVCASVSIAATFVVNHDGPLAKSDFKKDIARGKEAKILRQMIEDTDHYASTNLEKLESKRYLYKIQVGLILATFILTVINWMIK